MNYTINFQRHQVSVSFNRKRGRPGKTLTQKLQEGFSQLTKAAQDKRYSGTPLTKVCRRLFENKRSKRLFGLNFMAIAILAGAIVPSTSALTTNSEVEIVNISPQIIQLTTDHSVRMPVNTLKITQGYTLFHRGVDFAKELNSPVYPIMAGKIEAIFYDRFAYGNHIIINHGSGFKSLYGHLSRIIVQEGQEVDRGNIIGLVGSTGWSTGPHLHLEVFDNDRQFNPLSILK